MAEIDSDPMFSEGNAPEEADNLVEETLPLPATPPLPERAAPAAPMIAPEGAPKPLSLEVLAGAVMNVNSRLNALAQQLSARPPFEPKTDQERWFMMWSDMQAKQGDLMDKAIEKDRLRQKDSFIQLAEMDKMRENYFASMGEEAQPVEQQQDGLAQLLQVIAANPQLLDKLKGAAQPGAGTSGMFG